MSWKCRVGWHAWRLFGTSHSMWTKRLYYVCVRCYKSEWRKIKEREMSENGEQGS